MIDLFHIQLVLRNIPESSAFLTTILGESAGCTLQVRDPNTVGSSLSPLPTHDADFRQYLAILMLSRLSEQHLLTVML